MLRRLTLILSILVLAISGCSSGSSDDDGGSSPTPGGSSPTPSGVSPTPSEASPTPGGSSPTPGDSSPTPGGSSPTPTAAPSPGPTGTPTQTDQDHDGSPATQDCDDQDPTRYPGAIEVCDGKDNDCDTRIDEDVSTSWYYDQDKDGYGAGSPIVACSQPIGYVAASNDCDDQQATVYPAAPELCDAKDNDCDGSIDEGTNQPWYYDQDKDGYGAGTAVVACLQPVGYVSASGDCDDLDATSYPSAKELCDNKDNDCNSKIDDGAASTFYYDGDGDGYGSSSQTISACPRPTGYVAQSGDCDDKSATAYPGAKELCNGLDDDCDQVIDDGLPTSTWYPDVDKDGYGDKASSLQACVAPPGYIGAGGDCNDASASIHPGVADGCDSVDNDCDGSIDEDGPTTYYRDADGDTYGDPASTTKSCAVPAGYVANNKDCNDKDANVNPAATETCDGVDNNCSGQIDENAQLTWYVDKDADGYGAAATSTKACTKPAGYVSDKTDCNDNSASIYPGATETCNGLDDNCDGVVDEGSTGTYTWFKDADADGFGDSNNSKLLACNQAAGYSLSRGDCKDSDKTYYPGATDIKGDKLDKDCGGNDGPDAHVGLNASSFASLQSAINFTAAGTIWVGPGTYLEHDLTMYGAAVQLRSTRLAAATIIDAQALGRGFFFNSAEDSDSVLDGFTITHGTSSGYLPGDGAGISIYQSSPTIKNCIVTGNQAVSAYAGGGISVVSTYTAPMITNCLLSNNSAKYGGGISVKNSYCNVLDTLISGNVASGGGGGIDLYQSAGIYSRCYISQNSADHGGGLNTYQAPGDAYLDHLYFTSNIAVTYGGGSDMTSSSSPYCDNLYFTSNQAPYGAAMAVATSSAPVIYNMFAVGNVAKYNGGVFYITGASPYIQNLTAVNNTAPTGGGVYMSGSGSYPTFDSSILAYNSSYNFYNDLASPGNPYVIYSDLYAKTGPNYYTLSLGSDSTVLEPQFVGYSNGVPSDLHLAKTSPAVNTGNSSYYDYDGTRIDMGGYGSFFGEDWDRDADGVPDYFWPGTWANAPSGSSSINYDCHDDDATRQGC